MKRPSWDYDIAYDVFEDLWKARVVRMEPIVTSSTVDSMSYGIRLGLTYDNFDDEEPNFHINFTSEEWKKVMQYFYIRPGHTLLGLNPHGGGLARRMKAIEEFNQKHEELLAEYERLKGIFE